MYASAAEKTWRDHVKHLVYGSDAKIKRAEEAIRRVQSEYEAKLARQEKQISDLRGQIQAEQQEAASAAAEAIAAAEASVGTAAVAVMAVEAAEAAAAAAERVAAEAAAAKVATERAAAVAARKELKALQEQLDVARRGLSEVPLLREQL